jgi:uncharacterized protein YjbI with pentapeptide repeats
MHNIPTSALDFLGLILDLLSSNNNQVKKKFVSSILGEDIEDNSVDDQMVNHFKEKLIENSSRFFENDYIYLIDNYQSIPIESLWKKYNHNYSNLFNSLTSEAIALFVIKKLDLGEKLDDNKTLQFIENIASHIPRNIRNFRRVNLSGANLTRADLSNADLSHANLSNADLSYADLSHAKFYNASLSRSNLTEATWAKTDIHKTDLSHVIFKRTKFKDTYLFNSTLKNSILLNISDLSLRTNQYTDFENAITDNQDLNHKIDSRIRNKPLIIKDINKIRKTLEQKKLSEDRITKILS